MSKLKVSSIKLRLACFHSLLMLSSVDSIFDCYTTFLSFEAASIVFSFVLIGFSFFYIYFSFVSIDFSFGSIGFSFCSIGFAFVSIGFSFCSIGFAFVSIGFSFGSMGFSFISLVLLSRFGVDLVGISFGFSTGFYYYSSTSSSSSSSSSAYSYSYTSCFFNLLFFSLLTLYVVSAANFSSRTDPSTLLLYYSLPS